MLVSVRLAARMACPLPIVGGGPRRASLVGTCRACAGVVWGMGPGPPGLPLLALLPRGRWQRERRLGSGLPRVRAGGCSRVGSAASRCGTHFGGFHCPCRFLVNRPRPGMRLPGGLAWPGSANRLRHCEAIVRLGARLGGPFRGARAGVCFRRGRGRMRQRWAGAERPGLRPRAGGRAVWFGKRARVCMHY